MSGANKTVIGCMALVCLAAVEIAALSHGINGTALTAVVAAVSGIAGWAFGGRRGSGGR